MWGDRSDSQNFDSSRGESASSEPLGSRGRTRPGHWVTVVVAASALLGLIGWFAHGSPSEAKSVERVDRAGRESLKLDILPALNDMTNLDAQVHADRSQVASPVDTQAWSAYTVRRGDTLSAIFERAGLGQDDLQALLNLGGRTKDLISLRPGETIRIQRDSKDRLSGLDYALDPLDTLEVRRSASGLDARVRHVEPERSPVIASGTVSHSLSRAMAQAGLPSAIAAKVVRVFHWKVNFRREVRPGARFSVVYERMRHAGHDVGVGKLLAAELHLGDHVVRAFRYTDRDGDVGYYDAKGHSLKPSLLRTPVHYTRVSSPFSLHRYDPVVHVWRPHYGVDLAAPRGTPIKAAGDGVIQYIGRAAGYGNLVEIHNFGPYQTRYAHMYRFARGLHKGSHVTQGQVIGYVGATGEATGPHLHFEIRVHGKPRNPLKVPLPDASPVPKSEMAAFSDRSRRLAVALNEPKKAATELAARRKAWPPHLASADTPIQTADLQ